MTCSRESIAGTGFQADEGTAEPVSAARWSSGRGGRVEPVPE
jgi:hypothetical protein